MRIDHLALGYKIFTVSEADKAAALSALLKRNLSAKMDSSGQIYVSLIKAKRYEKALSNVKYESSSVKGLPSEILKYRHRYGVILGVMLSIVYIFIAFSFIWDVRIEGDDDVYGAKVEEELSQNGFSVGGSWRTFSLSSLETEILEKSDSIGWINISRRGAVAYVSVRAKNTPENEKNESVGFSNIVASRDCIIEEITVKSGIACVKAGDTVKQGQLLISGVTPSELGGGFVRAEGEIFGVLSESVEVIVPKEEAKKTYSKNEIAEISVNIFRFSIFFLKKYGNMPNDCVIIEDKEKCLLFGKYGIPFEIRRVYVQKAEEITVAYTEKEMISIASSRLNALMKYSFRASEVLKMKTVGGFTSEGYKLTTYATLSKDVGEERFFSEKGP